MRPPATPAKIPVRWEKGAPPPLPSNGNQPGRGSLRCARTTRQIPAAPLSPAVRHEAGPMAKAIALRAI